MKLFSLGGFNKYLIFPFCTPLFICASKYIRANIPCKNKSIIFLTFFMYIGMALNGFFLILSKYLQKPLSKFALGSIYFKENDKAINTTLNPEDAKKAMEENKLMIFFKSDYFTYLLVCLNSLFDLISTATIFYIEGKITELKADSTLEDKLKMCEMCFTIFFSYFILKTHFPRQQQLSILLIVISFIIFFIPTTDFPFIALLFILPFGGYGLMRVIDKWLIEKRGASPYFLVTFQGVSGIVYCFIFFMVNAGSDKPAEGSFDGLYVSGEDWKTLFTEDIVFYLSSMIFYGLTNMGIALIIYFFNPTMKIISDLVSTIVNNVVASIVAQGMANIPYTIVGYIIIIIASLIYSELVICNFWGLNYDSKREINKRSVNDYLNTEKDEVEQIDLNISMQSKEEVAVFIN